MALELHQPVSPAELHQTWSWWQWTLALPAALLLALVLLWLLRRFAARRGKKNRQKSISRALLTRSALQQLAGEQLGTSVIALRCSELLRGYIDETYAECTSFQTNSEFNNDANSLANLPSALRLEARTLLTSLDEYKYRGVNGSPLLGQQFIDESLQLLQKLELSGAGQK